MTTTDTIEKLLSNASSLPDDPCRKCSYSRDGSCCGCPDGRKYKEIVAEYEKAGIYDIALKIKTAKKLELSINVNSKKLRKIRNELPDSYKSMIADIGINYKH